MGQSKFLFGVSESVNYNGKVRGASSAPRVTRVRLEPTRVAMSMGFALTAISILSRKYMYPTLTQTS